MDLRQHRGRKHPVPLHELLPRIVDISCSLAYTILRIPTY